MPKANNVFLLVAVVVLFAVGWSQDIASDTTRSGLMIQCPQNNIPIYVDGTLVGRTPLPDVILVNPGEHQISFFPAVVDSSDSIRVDHSLPGAQTVMVSRGYVVPVKLDYRSMIHDADLTKPLPKGSPWIGLMVMISMLVVTFWGLG